MLTSEELILKGKGQQSLEAEALSLVLGPLGSLCGGTLLCVQLLTCTPPVYRRETEAQRRLVLLKVTRNSHAC